MLVSEKGKSLKGLKDDFGLLDFIIAEAIGKVKAVSSEMFIRNFQFKILRKTVFTNSRPIKTGFQMILYLLSRWVFVIQMKGSPGFCIIVFNYLSLEKQKKKKTSLAQIISRPPAGDQTPWHQLIPAILVSPYTKFPSSFCRWLRISSLFRTSQTIINEAT